MTSQSGRRPLQNPTPVRSKTVTVARARTAGVAERIDMPIGMGKEGVETPLRVTQQVNERFGLPPQRFIGANVRHPLGEVQAASDELASCIPATTLILVRAETTGDGSWIARALAFDLSVELEKAWRRNLAHAAREVQDRAARVDAMMAACRAMAADPQAEYSADAAWPPVPPGVADRYRAN